MERRFQPGVGIGPACANIGVPATPLLAGNPTDLGLGGYLESDYKSRAPLIGDGAYVAQHGKFKVPPCTASQGAPHTGTTVFSPP